MTYAVNLADLTALAQRGSPLLYVLRDVTPNHMVLDIDPVRFDSLVVLLECDDERAAAIIAVARLKLRPAELRFYHSRTGNGSWKQVRQEVVP